MRSKHSLERRAQVAAILRRLEGGPAGKHLRASVRREKVVEAVFETGKHFTVDELVALLAKRGTPVAHSTVYRAVKLLTQEGVLTERHFADDATRFELSEGSASHHDHLICLRCGAIVEFEEPRIEALQEELAGTLGYTVRSHVHELYGICPKCQQRAD